MQTLPIMDELEAALAGGTNARRIEMLTRITDLFVGGAARFTEAQTGVFDDIMVRLVSAIEAKARAKLAHRLAPIANAPLNTIHMLAFDDGYPTPPLDHYEPLIRAFFVEGSRPA